MSKNDGISPLGSTDRDRAVAVARGLAGMVPVAESLIAELITEVVPGQRQERIEHWLHHLAERLSLIEEATLRERLREPEGVALFEDGAYQAARAITDERRRQIAELVVTGITNDRRDQLQSRRLLRLLGELDDAEVIVLAGYLSKNRQCGYWEQHANVMGGAPPHLGSSRDEVDVAEVREAGRRHLVRLGLLEEGMIGGPTVAQLSSLGRLLLRRIGLAGDDDW
jgi:hypothetical protein